MLYAVLTIMSFQLNWVKLIGSIGRFLDDIPRRHPKLIMADSPTHPKSIVDTANGLCNEALHYRTTSQCLWHAVPAKRPYSFVTPGLKNIAIQVFNSGVTKNGHFAMDH